jgi:hypothetical protein
MSETGYTIPGSVNFKRLKHSELVSTTLDTKSNQQASLGLLEQARKFRCVEGFINHGLYERYSSSQNYYFLRDVNQILGDDRCRAAITYKDLLHFGQVGEQLKKFYRIRDYRGQMAQLSEFYKFHKEIPRMFSKEIYDTFFDHHDKKRKVEYVIITRQLKEQAGEDIKGQIEEQLKALRQVKFEPLLADLGPYVKQTVSAPKPKPRLKTQPNDSLVSLQDKLNDIFSAHDASISELLMKTFVDEHSGQFAQSLKLFAAPAANPISTVNITPGPPQPLQKFTVTSLITSALTSATSSKHNFKFPSQPQSKQSTLGLDPAVVESLKRISFPDSQKDTKKPTVGLKKTGSQQKLSQKESLASQPSAAKHSLVKPPTDRTYKKSSTREPSVTTARNKSSHSIKRGLTLTKRTLEEEGPKSAKREFSEFRITKKQSLEADAVSPRKPQAAEKRPEPYLIRDDRLEAASTRGGGNWLAAKRVPSAKRNTLIEATQKGLKKSSEFEAAGPSHQTQPETGSHLKVDIERLLKASGLMDMRTSRASVAKDMGATLKQSGLSKHKYTKSGPESFAQLAMSTARPAPSSHFPNTIRLASNEKDRAQKDKGVILGKKISLTEHKPLLAESSTFNQPAVKLIKKTSTNNHQKKVSSRF